MNYRLLSRLLGIVALLLGSSMFLSLPWTSPAWGGGETFERGAFLGLAGSIAITAAVAALFLYGVGPGLGTIGAVENYGHFQPTSKLLFVFLMIVGRLEIFPVLVLFIPRFWRAC